MLAWVTPHNRPHAGRKQAQAASRAGSSCCWCPRAAPAGDARCSDALNKFLAHMRDERWYQMNTNNRLPHLDPGRNHFGEVRRHVEADVAMDGLVVVSLQGHQGTRGQLDIVVRLLAPHWRRFAGAAMDRGGQARPGPHSVALLCIAAFPQRFSQCITQ